MILQQGSLHFPSTKDSGPQVVEQGVSFPRAINSVTALLAGFDAEYVNDDENLHLLEADVNAVNLSTHSAEVSGRFALRDASNVWDDRYGGSIRYVLVGTEKSERVLGGTLTFPKTQGSGPKTINENVRFTSNITKGAAILSGFASRFSKEDHKLLQMEADVSSQFPTADQIQVSGTYGLRDSSNNWDDDYEGVINYKAVGITHAGRGIYGLQTGRMDFAPQSGSGPREQTTTISFSQPIGNCAAVLTGFLFGFDKNDHKFGRVKVEVEARKLSETDVEVVGRLGLRDDSGNWDDKYRGSLRFAVLAE